MMLYLEYETLKRKYAEAEMVYDGILTEMEELFQRTQPKAVDTGKEKVSSCPQGSGFDSYLIAKEKKHIDDRLQEAKAMFEERKSILKQKEADLRASKMVDDRIYVMRMLDRCRIKHIASTINYSESHIKRRLRSIRKRMQENRC